MPLIRRISANYYELKNTAYIRTQIKKTYNLMVCRPFQLRNTGRIDPEGF
jgi:hypothetical protein